MRELEERAAGKEVTVPVITTVGETQYQRGELTVDVHKDGVELHLHFPAGPIHLWLRHDDSEQIRELLERRT